MGRASSSSKARTAVDSGSDDNVNIQIRVKTLDSNTHQVRVKQSASVGDLKQLLHTETGVSVDRQRLIFQGKVLLNEKAIKFYAIRDGVTIHMVERLGGPLTPPVRSTGRTSRSRRSNSSTRSRARTAPFIVNASPTLDFLNFGTPVGSGMRISHGDTGSGLLTFDVEGSAGLPQMQSIFGNVFGLVDRNNRANNRARRSGRTISQTRRSSSSARPRQNSSSRRERAASTTTSSTSTLAARLRLRSGEEASSRESSANSASADASERLDSPAGGTRSRGRIRRRRLRYVPIIRATSGSGVSSTLLSQRLAQGIRRTDSALDRFEVEYLRRTANENGPSTTATESETMGATETDQPLPNGSTGSNNTGSSENESASRSNISLSELSALGQNYQSIASLVRRILPTLDRMAVTLRTHSRRIELSRENGNQSEPIDIETETRVQADALNIWQALGESRENFSRALLALSDLSATVANSSAGTNRRRSGSRTSSSYNDLLTGHRAPDTVLMRVVNRTADVPSGQTREESQSRGRRARVSSSNSSSAPNTSSQNASSAQGNTSSLWDLLRQLVTPSQGSTTNSNRAHVDDTATASTNVDAENSAARSGNDTQSTRMKKQKSSKRTVKAKAQSGSSSSSKSSAEPPNMVSGLSSSSNTPSSGPDKETRTKRSSSSRKGKNRKEPPGPKEPGGRSAKRRKRDT